VFRAWKTKGREKGRVRSGALRSFEPEIRPEKGKKMKEDGNRRTWGGFAYIRRGGRKGRRAF